MTMMMIVALYSAKDKKHQIIWLFCLPSIILSCMICNMTKIILRILIPKQFKNRTTIYQLTIQSLYHYILCKIFFFTFCIHSIYKDKAHYKHILTVPDEYVDKLGWKDGADFWLHLLPLFTYSPIVKAIFHPL